MKKIFFLLAGIPLLSSAQQADHSFQPGIQSVKLYKTGDIYSYPVIGLNSGDQLELHFDDLDGDIKNYYYSYELCNADWSRSDLQTYDYIKGFQTTHINTYRNSSIAITRYTHYQALLPDRNSYPSRSGNYLLKVFLNDDTSQLVLTRRFLVVDPRTSASAQVLQALNMQLFKTHQRLQVDVSTTRAQINPFSPQDLKVVIVQNNMWATAMRNERPTIFRGNYYEYSDEETTTFPAGQEWRWVDLRSLRLMSDRVQKIVDTSKQIDVFVKADKERLQQIYVYYQDLDGIYTVENQDGNNPDWQSDYALVHFTFIPPGNRPFPGRSVYVFGELTNYAGDETSKMDFNDEKGIYEKTLFLKQGYYNYAYVTKDDRDREGSSISFDNTEGNYWGTENSYMILVYYRPFGARADELIGFTHLNSVFQR